MTQRQFRFVIVESDGCVSGTDSENNARAAGKGGALAVIDTVVRVELNEGGTSEVPEQTTYNLPD